MHKFCLGPTVYMGASSLEEVLSGTKKAFIVTDKFMHESGKVSYVSDFFDKIGAEYVIFSVSVKQPVPPLKAGSLLSSFCSGGMEVCESCDM